VLRFPQAIAYSPGASTILVADQYGSVVQRFDRTGAWLNELGGYADARQVGRIGVVGGLATDRAGHVYVLDSENDRVQVFEAATGRWLAAWGSTGQGAGQFRLGDNTGAGGLAVSQPTASDTPVAYVADQYNHRIQAFRLDRDASGDPGHPVLPAGAGGDVVAVPTPTVQWGSHGDCSASGCADPAFNDRLNYPQGVAVDARTGHVLVADDDNHRVVEFLPSGAYVRQLGSYGVGAGQFRFPYDVGIDAREPRQLYVADNNNHRVQAFDFASLAFQRTWGQFGTEVGDFGFTRALAAVADDPVGGVAVADTANNRVQTYAPDGAPTAAWGIAGRGPGYVTRPEGVAVDAAGTVHVADTLDYRLERLGADGAAPAAPARGAPRGHRRRARHGRHAALRGEPAPHAEHRDRARRSPRGFAPLLGAIRRATAAGAHRLTFRARLRGRPLRAGRYRLVLRAVDAAGNHARAKRLTFTVVAGR
jgi:DNA-binding beta-propeller fold protein YncE